MFFIHENILDWVLHHIVKWSFQVANINDMADSVMWIVLYVICCGYPNLADDIISYK